MKPFSLMMFFAALLSLQAIPAHACETRIQHSIEEIKELRDMLQKTEADPLDRLFAFEELACSERSTVRNYAIKEGLENLSDPLVRNEIMLRAMLQKTRVDVVLGNTKTLTKEDKQFISENGGVYSRQIAFRSVESGCMSLWSNKSCDITYSLFIRGDQVELNYKDVSGDFRLSDFGELVGTLRAENSAKYTRIPAVIKLF